MILSKIFKYIILILIPVFAGCSSRSYDIEEVEEESPEEQYKPTEPEIKKEIEQPKEDLKTNETKEEVAEDKTGPVIYTIQIGAFYIENNALGFLNEAKNKLGPDVEYRITDGLYKVNLGKYNTRSEALAVLGKIQESGYTDAFITVFYK